MTARYAVTGATGFLGEHVVRALATRGDEVVAIARSPSSLLGQLDRVEQVRVDVTANEDREQLIAALGGVDGLFHLAGRVSRDPADAQPMMRVHVDGTRRTFEAAAAAGVRRILVASTSGTIAVSREPRVHSERDGFATELVAGWPYYASKVYQEKLSLELAELYGLEVVFVNPSLLLGPGDARLSSTRDVLRFIRGQIPVVPSGGMNFVDVRDAAVASVSAMERGQAGERYLVGGPNWTVEEFFGRLSRAADVPAPRIKVPDRLSRWGAGLVEELYRARKRVPPIDKISVEMSSHYWYVDSSKAEQELGFEPREPSLTLADTVRYLRRDLDAVS